ncbi:hypothetical protein J6590_054517 [Homalodisca vitripennis]|nr:hypothetical protein J6590_054517 [Homalodisca vitripennis]
MRTISKGDTVVVMESTTDDVISCRSLSSKVFSNLTGRNVTAVLVLSTSTRHITAFRSNLVSTFFASRIL